MSLFLGILAVAAIFLVPCAIVLALFVGIRRVVHKVLGDCGRIGVNIVAVLLIITFVVMICRSPRIGSGIGSDEQVSGPPDITRPSPSGAMLAMTRSEDQYGFTFAGVNAHDGATVWRHPLDVDYANVGRASSADGDIFISGSAQQNTTFIAAYRLSDGTLLWRTTAPYAARLTPLLVTHGLLIFSQLGVADYSSEIISALNLTTHTIVWRANLLTTIPGDYFPEVAASANLLFVGGVGRDVNKGDRLPPNDVTALRLSDGRLIWSHQADQNREYFSLTAGLNLIYAADDTGAIVGLRQSDGAVAWRVWPNARTSGDAEVTFSGSNLYVCAASSSEVESLLALDPATGRVRWHRSIDCSMAPPIQSGGILYVTDKNNNDLVALHADTGATAWRAATQASDLAFNSMQVDHGVVFATAVLNDRNPILCPTWWSTARLFCYGTEFIAAFDGTTGARYWQAPSGHPSLFSSGIFSLSGAQVIA